VGHLLQSYFKSVLVDQDAYLLEACAIERMRAALSAA
jgi:hypothetical protein